VKKLHDSFMQGNGNCLVGRSYAWQLC